MSLEDINYILIQAHSQFKATTHATYRPEVGYGALKNLALGREAGTSVCYMSGKASLAGLVLVDSRVL